MVLATFQQLNEMKYWYTQNNLDKIMLKEKANLKRIYTTIFPFM